MFEIKKEKFGNFTKLKLINTKTGEYASIIPGFGTNVNEILLIKNGKKYNILDGDKDYKTLKKNAWFKGAKLTPFPNRINNGEYSFLGRKYKLPINFKSQNHAIHGLVYNKQFKTKRIDKNKNHISAEMEYDYRHETAGYPFNFKINVKYHLTKNSFKCTTEIRNTSRKEIPMGDGWHPYFKTKGKIDNLWLRIPSKRKIEVNNRMIPPGKKTLFNKFYKLSKIGKQNFDTGFELPKRKGTAFTQLYDTKENVRIIIWQETGNMKYNYLQIFIPPSRKSIAIEPMTCNTNAFNNKEGLIILKPKQTFKASYGVYLK